MCDNICENILSQELYSIFSVIYHNHDIHNILLEEIEEGRINESSILLFLKTIFVFFF